MKYVETCVFIFQFVDDRYITVTNFNFYSYKQLLTTENIQLLTAVLTYQ